MADSVRADGGSAASTPGEGPTGAAITVNGSGWQGVPDGTTVTFGYSTDPTCATSYTPVTGGQAGNMSSGAFSGWFRWPTSTPTGAYTVCASIGTTIVATGSYTVLSATPPQLSISASTLNVGQQATVTGSNFLPAQTSVSLVLQQLNGGTSVTLGMVTSDANGAFSQTYTIPDNPTGPVVLIANGGGGTPPVLTASATFIVYVPPVTPTPTPTPGTPTPTPTPGASPTPSPTPRPAPTPTPNNVTPTAIQTQGQTQATTPTATPAPTATPTPMAIVGSTATPNTGNPITQRSISTPTSNPGSGHSDIITVTLIVGTLFLSLIAAIAGLLFWKRRTTTKQQATFVDAQAAQATSSWNTIEDPFNSVALYPFATQPERSLASVSTLPGYPQPAQPYISGQPHPPGHPSAPGQPPHPPGRLCPPDSLPQGVSLLYTEPPTMRAGNGMEVGAAVLGQTRGLVADGREADGLGGTAHAALLQSPTGRSPASTANDLLHDPLFVAIMQQTRSGLFVLPGKGEE